VFLGMLIAFGTFEYLQIADELNREKLNLCRISETVCDRVIYIAIVSDRTLIYKSQWWS
jgi:hypothetical protein